MIIGIWADSLHQNRAEDLGERLSLRVFAFEAPWPPVPPAEKVFALVLKEQGLSLQPLWNSAPAALFVDFTSAQWQHRLRSPAHEPVARAVGQRRSGRSLQVVDLTAGLGGDAFILASLGARVVMHERHPVVAALLEDALLRLHQTKDPQLAAVAERLHLQNAPFPAYAAAQSVPDVLYLDPMFPTRGKQAKVRADMQMMHVLVGPDDDADHLLRHAMGWPVRRIVVKRPARAPWLAGLKPAGSQMGKRGRFDLYSGLKI